MHPPSAGITIGSYVLPGETVAKVWTAEAQEAEEAEERLRPLFQLGPQRTLPQDPSFPVRQLAGAEIAAAAQENGLPAEEIQRLAAAGRG